MQADADYVRCTVGDEPLSQFERGLDLGVHKIIRIALLLGPSHEFWNLSLWNSELPGFVCNRFADIVVVIPLELDYVTHHSRETGRDREQRIGKNTRREVAGPRN